MQDKILLLSLVIVMLIIALFVILKITEKPEKLKTHSLAIVDIGGQHIINETEFLNFMNRLETIFANHKNFNDWNDDISKRQKDKYIEPAADELKTWIRDSDNYPWKAKVSLLDPLDEEIKEMNSNSNPIMFNNSDRCNLKSLDGSHIDKENKDTLDDIAVHIRQIKEINMQYPEEERRSVKLTETHKLLKKLLKNCYKSDKTINDLIIELKNISTIPKFSHKEKESFVSSMNGRMNVVVDVSGFRDDDRVGTSRKSQTDDTNNAIEHMLVKKSAGHAKLTGGRKHIML
jgi:hypothetical protein